MNAWTLEWATPSPPPVYNFAVEPTVSSRRPLWLNIQKIRTSTAQNDADDQYDSHQRAG